MSAACATAVDTLNDILLFDKMDSGILNLHKTRVPIVEFINECVSMFAPLAIEKKIDFRTSINGVSNSPDAGAALKNADMLQIGDADAIEIDVFKFRQVMRNLISNAIKFTPRNGQVCIQACVRQGGLLVGSTTRSVDSSAVDTSNHLEIQIVDTGVGIDVKDQNKLFNEIFQFNQRYYKVAEEVDSGY